MIILWTFILNETYTWVNKMFKLLALFVLFLILFRAIGMVIKMVIGGNTDNRQTRYSNPNKSNKDYEGGEYVDYEDVD